ncbi:hypothetical protein [Egbenema bharatensis]|uniref:hypothetical protein n=1 Tax=Egbenema bharatensis TaxID=3463334 RepID=UPI003A886943
MNRVWTRLVRSPQGREPISRFILTAGLVDAVIGGVGGHWSLLAVGLSAVSVAIGLRWRSRRSRFEPIQPREKPPTRYLTAQSSRTMLPTLTSSRHKR